MNPVQPIAPVQHFAPTPIGGDSPDPREVYQAALDWVAHLVAATRPDQLDDITPCADWDVRTLLGHLVATVDRARIIGEGALPFSVPSIIEGVPDDGWVARLAVAEQELWSVWADDTTLDAQFTAPWGPVSGRGVLFGYAQEAVVHGWDLALATGQPSEAPSGLAEPLLASAVEQVPGEHRGGPIPFGAVVTSPDGAGPTERLAAWLGHSREA